MSGGPDAFRPSGRAALLLAGCGVVLLGTALAWRGPLEPAEAAVALSARQMLSDGRWLTPGAPPAPIPDVPPLGRWSVGLAMSLFGPDDWVACLPSALASLATALLVAALATRWLGRRIGWLSGLVYLSSAGVLMQSHLPCTDALLALSVTAAIGAFGLGNAAGRLPLCDGPWAARAFYAATGVSSLLAGPAGALVALGVCAVFLGLGEDSRGGRFLADPGGLLIFGLLAVAWPATVWLARPAGWDGRWEFLLGWFAGAPGQGASPLGLLRELGLAALPWTPLAVAAMVVGLRRGHADTPAWRLFGAWALAPLVLMAAGVFRGAPHLGVLLPPVAVMAAAGLSESLRWVRRRAAALVPAPAQRAAGFTPAHIQRAAGFTPAHTRRGDKPRGSRAGTRG